MSTSQVIYQGQDFYVPAFEVNPPGKRMPRDVLHDVLDVTYRDGIGEVDSFSITVNNWDSAKRTFKYSETSTFLPGKKLDLWVGYRGKGALSRLMTGEITAMRPSFPASGRPTLVVTVLNLLHRLRDKQNIAVYENKTASQIAKQVADQIGVPIHTAPSDEQPYPYLLQKNEYDVLFLMRLAARAGYDLWVDEDLSGGKPVLHFEPSAAAGRVDYRLTWGKSLIEFEPTLNTARQVDEVVVWAWDRRRKKQITATAKRGSSGDPAVRKAFNGRGEVVYAVVASEQEAHRIAKDRLAEIGNSMIQATGSTVGLPGLRAGRKVRIDGVGPRFDGTYFVTGTQHSLGDSGYRTSFDCRRED
ncbi:phage protein D [Kibdelosporangium banguiense]|uniref:Phage protein D n=1 Tax=Kibdelosporangium banguiense TaxID=1365924 RepID=A0ABS4TWU0_9PSEU|nr:contractile injection system protein, VgrG/Pvc8 family [Kibdelosporangium banguiense]MBP2328876.1 phage protein D [Kibdelosporangium banguiense]